jgi:hypothetical protein
MRVVLAQIRVGRELARNGETIRSLLRRSRPGDWVVFPEGALTGYFPGEDDYLASTGPVEVEAAPRSIDVMRWGHPWPGLAIWIRLPHVSSRTAVVTGCISSGSCVKRTPSARSRSYSAFTSSTANDV